MFPPWGTRRHFPLPTLQCSCPHSFKSSKPLKFHMLLFKIHIKHSNIAGSATEDFCCFHLESHLFRSPTEEGFSRPPEHFLLRLVTHPWSVKKPQKSKPKHTALTHTALDFPCSQRLGDKPDPVTVSEARTGDGGFKKNQVSLLAWLPSQSKSLPRC